MKKTFMPIILATVISCGLAKAQTNTFPPNGAEGIGTTAPDISLLLEIKSTDKGFVMSGMTRAQRDAISAPVTGLMIYQTNNSPGFYYYTGSAWQTVTTRQEWPLTGNALTDSSQNVNNSVFIGSNTFISDSNVIISGTNQNVGINTSYKPGANGTILSKELRLNDIPISTRRNFMISFKDIQNVEWHKTREGYFAYFNQGGIAEEIRYNQSGRWLCSIRTYYEDQLSPSIKNLVKSKYKDYAIVIVREYECSKGTAWIVSLEGKSEQILLRVEEDEMREVHHFYKSK